MGRILKSKIQSTYMWAWAVYNFPGETLLRSKTFFDFWILKITAEELRSHLSKQMLFVFFFFN